MRGHMCERERQRKRVTDFFSRVLTHTLIEETRNRGKRLKMEYRLKEEGGREGAW